MIQSHFFGSLARFGWMSVSILGRRVSGMKKQRCSGFRRLIVATQGDGSPSIAISRAFVEVSAGTRRTIARPKGERLLTPRALRELAGWGVLESCGLRLRGRVGVEPRRSA